MSPRARCGWWTPRAETTGRSPNRSRRRGRPVSPTGSRSSSRPRRWGVPGASGGRRTAAGCSWRAWTTRRYSGGGSRIPPARSVSHSTSRTRRRARRTRTYGCSWSGSKGSARRWRGTGLATRIWPECTGQRRVRRCCSCRRGTSAASCSWRWTRTPGRRAWCTRTKIQVGLNCSPECPAGAPPGSLSGSRTRVAHGCWRSANGP